MMFSRFVAMQNVGGEKPEENIHWVNVWVSPYVILGRDVQNYNIPSTRKKKPQLTPICMLHRRGTPEVPPLGVGKNLPPSSLQPVS